MRAIRKVLTLGCAALLAGACGVAHAQSLLVTNDFDNSVEEYSLAGTLLRVFVQPGSGGLDRPYDLAVGPDANLYVAGTVAVKEYSGVTGGYLCDVVTGLSSAAGISFDPTGALLVTDQTTNTVRRVDATTGSTLAVYSSGLVRPGGISFR